ncbi:MAG: serine/threonine protein phosphatase, partial [Cyclobacteriaceae bacterium]
MSPKLKIQLTFFLGLLSWLLFSFFDIYFILLQKYEMEETYVELVPQIFLSIFIISSLIYYRFIITKAESINFTDLLWRVFITGLVTTIISLGIRLVFNLYENTSFIKNPLTINFFYHIYIALVVIFLISTFVVWKRLILYQKSKQLIRWWNAFEYLLVGALIYDFLGFKYLTIPFNIPFAILGIFSLVLSFNLKWIAYLNFKQKWKSILFILLSGIYLYHFVLNLSLYSDTDALIYDLFDRVFILALFVFIMIYAVIAILVTLFNLPTSSVFEKKLQEAVDFQKLSQSVPAGQSESETYDILLDGSMSAVFADAAWLEVKSDGSSHIITRNIREDEIPAIKAAVKDASLRQILDVAYSGRMIQKKVYTSLSKGPFRSVFVLPILVKNTQVGTLVLLQEVSDAFNREMVNIITTFVNQASVSLENTRLIGEALENERYKEQLKIAKNVQRSLLPEKLPSNDKIEIAAYSMAA